ISIWQILAPLLVGGRVHIMNDDIARDARQLLKETEAYGITVLETVPTMLGMMVYEQEQAASEPVPLGNLRWLFCQAEPLPSKLCSQWRELHPRTGLVNAYGLTECSDDISHCHIGGPLPGPYAPLGSPLMNAMIYVLDPCWQPVPLGVAGELYIGGLCLGRGYLNRPDLTAGKFVPNPYSMTGGDRMYRTGDLGRWRADGSLEFLGRIDFQVKIRGQRVELGEIEAVLAEHDDVGQCVVVVREGRAGEKRLVAYYAGAWKSEGEKGKEVEARELRTYLEEKLPAYM